MESKDIVEKQETTGGNRKKKIFTEPTIEIIHLDTKDFLNDDFPKSCCPLMGLKSCESRNIGTDAQESQQ